MTLPVWREESIAKAHDRQSFDCGDAAMNDFFRRHARQSHEHNASKSFCAVEAAKPSHVLGFYTLAPSAVAHEQAPPAMTNEQAPPAMTKGLARHDLPGFKLARLAVDLRCAGQGLGGQLLAAAALRCLRIAAESGGLLLIIDAKNERAAHWYAGFGAEPLKDRPLTLVMPLATFASELTGRGFL